MTEKLSTALAAVQMTYKDIVSISDDILQPTFAPVDEIIAEVNNNVYNLSTETVRNHIVLLQLKAYEISETKEKATFTAKLAEAIQKEKAAIAFNGHDGAQGTKEKLALLDTSEEIISQLLYTLIADRLKTKVDQIHRMVDALKSVLMSRMQETKFMNLAASSEIPATTNGKVNL